MTEELNQTPIPNVNFTVVMNLQEHEDGTPHPQLYLMVTDKESVNILREFFPAYRRTPEVLQKVEEKFDIPLDVATYGFKVYERIFGMMDEATGMPPLNDAFSKFGTDIGLEHEGLGLDEDFNDTEKGSFLYLLSEFLYAVMFNTTTQPTTSFESLLKVNKGYPSIGDYIKEGKLEVTFKPGFKENFEPEIVEAWDAFYNGFTNMFSPSYESYVNAIKLFDHFKDELQSNGIWFVYDAYFDFSQEWRDEHMPIPPLQDLKLKRQDT